MSLKDIEKLREKVDSDPNSKLFVPLAEEYRKEGMIDEAIDTLLSGIERQPGYLSARVSLGKIYSEKGLMKEARAEFENVVKMIPDNLYAHKKLAEIYRDTGETQAAIHAYRTVLKLNSMDDDALANLRTLEGVEFDEQPEVPAGAVATADEVFPADAVAEVEAEEGELSKELAEEVVEEAAEAEDAKAVNDFAASFPDDEQVASSGPSDADAEEIGFLELGEDEFIEDAGISFADVDQTLTSEGADREDSIELPAVEEEDAMSVEEVSVAAAVPSTRELPQTPASLEESERLIAEGNFAKAASLYQKMLSGAPGDKKVLQRIEELRALLKLLGRDKEIVVSRLETFLGGMRKRRDEFFGRS